MRNFSQNIQSSSIIQYYSCNDEYSRTICCRSEILNNLLKLNNLFGNRKTERYTNQLNKVIDFCSIQYHTGSLIGSPEKKLNLLWESFNNEESMVNDYSGSELTAIFEAMLFMMPLWLDKYSVPSTSNAFFYANLNDGESLLMIYTYN